MGQPLILNVLMSDAPNSMHTYTAGKKWHRLGNIGLTDYSLR